jgi:hypothetical protein
MNIISGQNKPTLNLHSMKMLFQMPMEMMKVVAQAQATLNEKLQLFKSEAMKQLDCIFTSEFGINAVHQGVAPYEMVKPAGRAAMGYQSIHNGVLNRRNVLANNEIQFFKFESETDIYCHAVNLTNRVLCHGYSAYCWNLFGNARVPYDTLRHSQLEPFL